MKTLSKMTTRAIKPFVLEGEFLDDSYALLARVNATNTIEHQIRDAGCLKVLDLDPIWVTEYNHQDDKWFFHLAIYAIYVGKKKAWEFEGITQGKLVPRSTPKVTHDQ